MCTVMETIARAEENEVKALLDAILQRYSLLFPDWEICTISLEKGADRNEQLDRIIDMLQKMKTST